MSSPTTNTTSPQGKSTEAREKTISEKLAHKRSLDRKAQQAARSRTKWTIENLQYQVAHLNNALISETTRLQSLLHQASEETALLRAENDALKARLSAAMQSQGNVDDHGSEDMSNNSPAWDDEIVRLGSLPPYEAVPWNIEPTCTSDGILQTYAKAARSRVHATSDIFLEEQPDLTTLLAQGRGTNPFGVSNVVSDILLAYHEINTLPKKAACLYVMYKLLNWLIYRTRLTYDQLPKWLRPVPIQLRVKHAAWIDRIPWPSARIYLIEHPEVTFDEFVKHYSSSFHVSWPYDDTFVLITLPQKSPPTDAAFNDWFVPSNHVPGADALPREAPVLNPVFEQHLRQLKNWSVSRTFKDRFPELSAAMEADSLVDFDEHYSPKSN